MRRNLPRALVACWLSMTGVSGTALAQKNPSGDVLLDGSAGQQAMRAAALRNGQVFGAAGYLDTVLVPAMASHPDENILTAQSSILQGMIKAPAHLWAACDLGQGGSCPYGKLAVDAFSSSGGLGWQGENLSLFYVASTTAMRLTEEGTQVTYPLFAAALAGLGFFSLYTAPVTAGPLKVTDGIGSLFEMSSNDYIVGGGARVTVLGLTLGGRVGFLGSDSGSGAYVRLEEGVSHLVASAIWRKQGSDLPYATVGVQHAPWLAQLLHLPGADAGASTVSLYARSLRLEPFVSPADGVASKTTLWTAHAGVNLTLSDDFSVDAAVAAGVRPSVFLHEARGSLFYGTRKDVTGVLVSASYVGMPEMMYYGARGGGSLGYSVEVMMSGFRLAVRRNDSAILMRYPFAQGETEIFLGYGASAEVFQ